jgi:hypothetical protein
LGSLKNFAKAKEVAANIQSCIVRNFRIPTTLTSYGFTKRKDQLMIGNNKMILAYFS